MDPKQIARDIRNRLEVACGEIAYEAVQCPFDEKTENKIAKAKKDGVRDIAGWLADEYFNDPDFLSDMIGDWAYDATKGDEALVNQVYDALSKNAHEAMRKAIEGLRR